MISLDNLDVSSCRFGLGFGLHNAGFGLGQSLFETMDTPSRAAYYESARQDSPKGRVHFPDAGHTATPVRAATNRSARAISSTARVRLIVNNP